MGKRDPSIHEAITLINYSYKWNNDEGKIDNTDTDTEYQYAIIEGGSKNIKCTLFKSEGGKNKEAFKIREIADKTDKEYKDTEQFYKDHKNSHKENGNLLTVKTYKELIDKLEEKKIKYTIIYSSGFIKKLSSKENDGSSKKNDGSSENKGELLKEIYLYCKQKTNFINPDNLLSILLKKMKETYNYKKDIQLFEETQDTNGIQLITDLKVIGQIEAELQLHSYLNSEGSHFEDAPFYACNMGGESVQISKVNNGEIEEFTQFFISDLLDSENDYEYTKDVFKFLYEICIILNKFSNGKPQNISFGDNFSFILNAFYNKDNDDSIKIWNYNFFKDKTNISKLINLPIQKTPEDLSNFKEKIGNNLTEEQLFNFYLREMLTSCKDETEKNSKNCSYKTLEEVGLAPKDPAKEQQKKIRALFNMNQGKLIALCEEIQKKSNEPLTFEGKTIGGTKTTKVYNTIKTDNFNNSIMNKIELRYRNYNETIKIGKQNGQKKKYNFTQGLLLKMEAKMKDKMEAPSGGSRNKKIIRHRRSKKTNGKKLIGAYSKKIAKYIGGGKRRTKFYKKRKRSRTRRRH